MKNKEHSVAVLMSTYNGEQYIQEQIESIFSQDYSGNITIIIRDDGSDDFTCKIIAKIKQTENRKLVLYSEENIGPQRSFLRLLAVAPQNYSYYCFADQDDVWNCCKISELLSKFDSSEVPTLVCSNYSLVNFDLSVIEDNAIKKKPNFAVLRNALYNEIPGCTMCFNYALMKVVKEIQIEDVMMHDSYVLSLASMVGKVIYIDKPLIKHRIHENNVIGSGKKPIDIKKWLPDKLKLIRNGEHYSVSEMAEKILCVSKILVDDQKYADFELLATYKQSIFKTFKLLLHKDLKNDFWDRTTLSVRCRILFHLY